MKNIFLLMACSILCMQSCVKPLDVVVPQMESKLAINSQIISNQVVLVSVTRTFTSLYQQNNIDTALSNPVGLNLLVASAFVTVSHKNIIDTLQQIAPGIYASAQTTLMDNDSYVLNVYDSVSKQSVSSTTTKMPFVNVDAIAPFKNINGTDTSINIACTINDDAAIENYYFISIAKTNKTSGGIDLPGNIQQIFNKSSYIYLYTDKDAVNGKLKIDLAATNAATVSKTDTVLVQVANIEKGYYQYLTAFKKTTAVINQLTGEPINLPSNIYNGYGYFSAHFPYLQFIDLSKY
jgi:Domain of unknown function (DUF4249)